jgi:hypothetical protein
VEFDLSQARPSDVRSAEGIPFPTNPAPNANDDDE